MSGLDNGEKKAVANLIRKIIWISEIKKVGGRFSNSSTLLGARRR
jgi:hypothetical protein